MSEEVDSLIEQGQKALDKGDFKGATTRFNKAIAIEPDNAEAHFGRAEAAIGLPKLTLVDVAGYYRKAIELAPDNAFFLTSYGEFCLSHGLLPQAVQQYEKAAEIDPENAHLYYSDLALGYFHNGLEFIDRQADMSEEAITRNALTYYLKAFSIPDDKADGLLLRVCGEKNRLTRPDKKKAEAQKEAIRKAKDEVVLELLRSLEAEPRNPMTLISLGQHCIENGSLDAGVDYFLTAAQMDEDNAPFFFNDLSTAIYAAGGAPKGAAPGDDVVARSLCFALNALGYLEGERARELLASRKK